MQTEQVYTSKRHKIFGVIALAGLFTCGLLVGIFMSSKDDTVKSDKHIEMSEEQCRTIARRIVSDNLDANKLEQLNDIYSKNCYGRVVDIKITENAQKPKLPEKTCEAIEVLLKEGLQDETNDCQDLCFNLAQYDRLRSRGCPENVGLYDELYNRTSSIIQGINCWCDESVVLEEETCQRIENELLRGACPNCNDGADGHIRNAKIYAIVAERGCPEHREEYVNKVKSELEIARALEDDKFDEGDTIEVVETYKRINMQNTAQEFFDKAKKLTNPAIDFILEVQKIIEE